MTQEVQEFIRRELEQHGKWLSETFVAQLEANDNRVTGNLARSLGFEVDGDTLRIGFTEYGRFFEIRGQNSRRERKNAWPADVNRTVWGIRKRQPRQRKTRWYAKNMYGGLGKLVARLSAGMSEEELREIKKSIEASASRMELRSKE